MINIQNLTSSQLRKVITIKERIEGLEADLNALVGGSNDSPVVATRGPGRPKGKGRRKMSAAAKARIAAAQRARWAKVHAAAAGKKGPAPAAKTGRKRRKMSPAVRAKLAAIARARWAKVKASGKSAL
jgi:hypothetical protein